MDFSGVYPVLVTPFDENDAIDDGRYRALLEWYLERGIGGFYANCGSSEMFSLSDEERLRLVELAAETVRGRVPIAATGNLGPDLDAQLTFCRRVRDAGADVVMIRVPPEDLDDAGLFAYYATFAEQLDFPLGIYEIRQYFAPDLLDRLARTGRYVIMKETSSDLARIEAKVRTVTGTPLRLFQANTPYLPESIRWGAAGAMSIASDVVPELVRTIIGTAVTDPAQCEQLHAVLCEFDLLIRLNHPTTTKQILAWRGVPISPRSRRAVALSPELARGLERAIRCLLDRTPGLVP